jgi:hypothetical protein
MQQIGEILQKDYLLLQRSELVLPDILTRLNNHAEYLTLCDFKEFRLLIPHNTPEPILDKLNGFIQAQKIPGALRYYLEIGNQTKFDEEVTLNPELSFKDWVAVLPSEDFRYENFAKRIWNLSLGGKSLLVLLPERVSSWRQNISMFKRLSLKGATLAMSGSTSFKLGFFHTKKLTELHKSRNIHMWLTPQIYDINSAIFKKDMTARLAAITAIKTSPNDL